MTQRIIDAEIEDRTEDRHADEADEEGRPVGPAEIDREHHHQEGGDHRELALREIDDVGRAKDQHETERHQRIDRADADAREEKLEDEVHEVA